jgi:hypothetical protein
MTDALTVQGIGYSLSESGILSSRFLSTATFPDVLARPEAFRDTPGVPVGERLVFRKSGTEGALVVEVNGRIPRSLRESINDVLDLLDLPAGWNSYSAKPIAVANVIRVIQLLADVLGAETPRPIIVPRVRGGIQLEWHMADVDIEIYVDSPAETRFFAEQHGTDETIERQLVGHEDELRSWLQRISRK